MFFFIFENLYLFENINFFYILPSLHKINITKPIIKPTIKKP